MCLPTICVIGRTVPKRWCPKKLGIPPKLESSFSTFSIRFSITEDEWATALITMRKQFPKRRPEWIFSFTKRRGWRSMSLILTCETCSGVTLPMLMCWAVTAFASFIPAIWILSALRPSCLATASTAKIVSQFLLTKTQAR